MDELQHLVLTDVVDTGEELGRGSYGTVYKVLVNGTVCAGKRLHKGIITKHLVSRFVDECLCHSKQRHINIVQLIGVTLSPLLVPTLVMEYLPHSLSKCLESHQELSLHVKYSILLDVAKGLNYLHHKQPPIIHRDLTANNVLLTSTYTAKITDLGVSRMLGSIDRHKYTQAPGNVSFMPPEALEENPEYDEKLDVFSYGCLILHVFGNYWPFPTSQFKANEGGTYSMVSEWDRRSKYASLMSADNPFRLFAEKCLKNDSHHRPSISQALTCVSEEEVSADASTLQQSSADGVERLKEENENYIKQIEQLKKEINTLTLKVESLQRDHKNDLVQKESLQKNHFDLLKVNNKLKEENESLYKQTKILSEACHLIDAELSTSVVELMVNDNSQKEAMTVDDRMFQMLEIIIDKRLNRCPHSFQLTTINKVFLPPAIEEPQRLNFLSILNSEENSRPLFLFAPISDKRFNITDINQLTPHPEYAAAQLTNPPGITYFDFNDPVKVGVTFTLLGCIALSGSTKLLHKRHTTEESRLDSQFIWVDRKGQPTLAPELFYAQEYVIKESSRIYPCYRITLTRVNKHVVWVDPNINNYENSHSCNVLKQNRSIQLHPTNNKDDAVKALMMIKEKKNGDEYRAVTAGTGGPEFMKSLTEAGINCKVLVYCGTPRYHNGWASKYRNVEVTNSTTTFMKFATFGSF